MLIQENQQETPYKNNFTHTTTYTTTTTQKSSSCGSESLCHKKTVRTVIMEDQMSTCSCGKKSIKGSECGGSSVYGGTSFKGNRRDTFKSAALSDVSSLAEFQEMAFTLNGLNQQVQHNNQQFFTQFKKGPSSITSVKTVQARC